MHLLLPLKVKIGIVVGIAAAIAWLASRADLDPIAIGTVVGLVEAAVVILLLHSWRILRCMRWLPLPAWMKVDLSGRWQGTIASQWQGATADGSAPTIPVELDVTQTWQEVVFTLQSASMRSRSRGATPRYDPIRRELQIEYLFSTEPTAASNHDNPPQRLGCAVATVRLDEPNTMTIRYTNERSPGGDIALSRQVAGRRGRHRS